MPNIFSGSSVFFVLSHALFYICLTVMALAGSIVTGDPWLTRSLTLILISETYMVLIWYVTSPTRHHIGIQIRTTDAIHTLAYQVIPTSLNRHQFNRLNLPSDYRVSRDDLYVGDILFDPDVPALGLPDAEDIEVLRAPPPYPAPVRPLAEAARDPLPNLGNRPFGLPTGVRGPPASPQGTNPANPPSDDLEITDAELAAAIIDALHPAIRFGDPHDE